MEKKIIQEEADFEEVKHYSFMIQKLLAAILSKGGVSKTDKDKVFKKLDNEITGRPFKVAVIGQSGVGKSSTLNAVFGLNLPVSDIQEGTTEIIEKVFPMRDGFNLSIYDMPGLLQSRKRDNIYEEMYKEILPQCDVIVYIIKANTRNLGDDCRILKNVVLPICNQNSIKDNLIVAVNKVDTIGETIDPEDPELVWDPIENKPSKKLWECIKKKRLDIFEKLISENLVLLNDKDALKPEQVVFFSAVFEYNLGNFLKAITNAGKRGWIWAACIGYDQWKAKFEKKNIKS